MSQSKVTDFFNTRRRNPGLQPSKRRKINSSSDVGINLAKAWGGSRTTSRRSADPQKADLKIPPPVDLQSPANVGDHTPEISAACDDHNGSPPGTPTKRASSGEKTIQAKRSRSAKSVRKDLLDDLTKTPEQYDFTRYVKSEKKSARKRLLLEPKPSVPIPESLSPKQKNETQKAETSTAETLRARLSKSGKLAELQENLAKYSDSVRKVKASRSKALKEILEKEKEEQEKEENETAEEKGDLKTAEKNEVKTTKKDENVGTPKKNVKETAKKEETIVGTPKKVDNKTRKGKGMEPVKKAEAIKLAKTVLKAPEKEEKVKETKTTTKAPAYERFQHLVAPAPPSTLTLPVKFGILGEMFTKADDVVRMLYNRAETCTFSKLRGAVQRMMRKNFEELHLGQIKTVMPESYTVRQVKGLPTHGYQNLSRGEYQLTVEPILDAEDTNKAGRQSFTPDHQIRRKNIFYRALVAIVKKFHQEFLASLSMSLDDDKITHWHPRFKLNDIPDIEPADLPKPPNTKKLTTASEVLEQAKGTLNPRIQKALELISGPVEKKSEVKPDTKSKTPEKKETSGISSSLLERIRAKERAKQEMALTRSPADKERGDRISRLPELCQILRNIFIISKKPALPIEHAIQKISDSYRTSLGLMETEKHLDLMRELLPEWIQTLKVKKGTFIKVDKNKDIKDILQKLESAKKKLG